MTHKYVMDKGWQIILNDIGISTQDVLRHAQLPLDLMSRKSPTVTADEYFRMWDGLSYIMKDNPTFPLQLAQAITVEAFSPPIFACFCSENLNTALNRLAYYKPIVGPLRLNITQNSQHTIMAFDGLPENGPPPSSLMAVELVFWVHVARMATRDHIIPKMVHSTIELPAKAAYEEFFGVPITRNMFNGLTFSADDAARPFLTANEEMWSIFEPKLNMRMKDLEVEAEFRDRVRACLMEIIASGQYSMADVATRLAVSTHTLQRRLKEEGTTFQNELDSLREQLARNYLSKSDYTSGQIAFLLGYSDPNSFYRAFRNWTGQTPEVVRAKMQI